MRATRMNPFLLMILYSLSFALVREALRPIMALTNTGYVYLFLLFVAGSFILSLLKVKWLFTAPLKMIYIIWAIQIIYVGSSVISLDVISLIFRAFSSDMASILAGDWQSTTNVLRTLLFFLLLWMLTYLIRYWIEVKQSLLLFYFTVIAFLAVVDTFSPYSVKASILSVMVIGLLLLGLLTITRLSAQYKIPFSMKGLMAIVTPLIFFLVVSALFMTLLPKYNPVWADPVPFIKSMAEQETREGQTVSKSGYGTNDGQLGGPFLEDDSLVFEVDVDGKQYWKIETKDTYTSKGWEQSVEDANSPQFSPGELMQPTEADEFQWAELTMTEKFPFIIYPYGMVKTTTTHDALFTYDRLTEKYETTLNNEVHPLDVYETAFVEQNYSLTELRETTLAQMPDDAQLDPYLQLPSTLPERIGELAVEITESSDSVYEKAKAIERYFGRNGFVYERTDVAIPTEDDDYVDQFLFDTKKGYCDNFSSSMVVMLRTLDIPARWVKGFAPGELSTNENGERVYRVSNNEAHSWVEAYMPGIGWVPFEPTIGFSGAADVTDDLQDDLAEDEMPDQELEKPEPEQKEEVIEEEKTNTAAGVSIREWFMSKIRIIIIGVVSLFVIGLVIYAVRRRWMPKVMLRRSHLNAVDWVSFKGQYEQLVKQLARCGLRRAPSETLASFAVKVDRHFGGEEMQQLTVIYEKGIYGKIRKDEEWQRLQKMWEDLIIKTSN